MTPRRPKKAPAVEPPREWPLGVSHPADPEPDGPVGVSRPAEPTTGDDKPRQFQESAMGRQLTEQPEQ